MEVFVQSPWNTVCNKQNYLYRMLTKKNKSLAFHIDMPTNITRNYTSISGFLVRASEEMRLTRLVHQHIMTKSVSKFFQHWLNKNIFNFWNSFVVFYNQPHLLFLCRLMTYYILPVTKYFLWWNFDVKLMKQKPRMKK